MSKNLVIGIVGDESLHQEWISKSADFDLMLIYYQEELGKYREDAKYYLDGVKGSKWSILYEQGDFIKPLLENYNYIFIPDDDLSMSPDIIGSIFQLMAEHNLWLSQPAINGYLSVGITKPKKSCKLRFTNWVEIMCPCFHRGALRKCWETFNTNKSNWGISFLWNALLENPVDKIAILDCLPITHTRKPGSGENYKRNLKRNAALNEMQQLLEQHNLTRKKIIYSTIPPTAWLL